MEMRPQGPVGISPSHWYCNEFLFIQRWLFIFRVMFLQSDLTCVSKALLLLLKILSLYDLIWSHGFNNSWWHRSMFNFIQMHKCFLIKFSWMSWRKTKRVWDETNHCPLWVSYTVFCAHFWLRTNASYLPKTQMKPSQSSSCTWRYWVTITYVNSKMGQKPKQNQGKQFIFHGWPGMIYCFSSQRWNQGHLATQQPHVFWSVGPG